jgi:hypothetical protein
MEKIRMSKQKTKNYQTKQQAHNFHPRLRYLRCLNFLGTLIDDPFGTASSLSINPYTCDGRRSIYANSQCISYYDVAKGRGRALAFFGRTQTKQNNNTHTKTKQKNNTQHLTSMKDLHSASWSNGKIPRWGGLVYCFEVLNFIDDMVSVVV